MRILDTYFLIGRWKLFLCIVGANLLLVMLSQVILFDETVFFNTYSEQLTYERTIELFSFMKSYSWINYFLTPLLLLVKFSVLSLVIYVGVFFCDLQKEISLGRIFNVVIGCEIVYILASLAKVLWFTFFAENYTINDLNFFYPLSLINLFRQSEIASYWIYPMQMVNLFQLLYVLMLAFGLSRISSLSRDKTDKIVLMTYLPAVAIWVTFIMFLNIDKQL